MRFAASHWKGRLMTVDTHASSSESLSHGPRGSPSLSCLTAPASSVRRTRRTRSRSSALCPNLDGDRRPSRQTALASNTAAVNPFRAVMSGTKAPCHRATASDGSEELAPALAHFGTTGIRVLGEGAAGSVECGGVFVDRRRLDCPRRTAVRRTLPCRGRAGRRGTAPATCVGSGRKDGQRRDHNSRQNHLRSIRHVSLRLQGYRGSKDLVAPGSHAEEGG